MRKSLGAVAVATILAVIAVPSPANARVTEVDGNRFRPSSLVKVVAGCNDPAAVPVESPAFLMKRGPGKAPVGQYSSGWNVTGDQFAVGTLSSMKSPTSLSTFRISAVAPGDELEGVAMVRYYPDDDTGHWVGLSLLGIDTQRGWHTVNAAGRTFTWQHYTSTGTVDRTAPPSTIATHTSTYGGDAGGAELGFLYGCNEKPFFVDGLQIASDDDSLRYDYGGFRTRAEIRVGSRRPVKTTITAGTTLTLAGRLFEKYAGDRLSGSLHFESKPLQGGEWKTLKKLNAGRNGPAQLKARPVRSTAYRILYPGTRTSLENDVSNVLKVVVKMKATAHFADATITRGTTYAAVGRVAPGKRTKVQLQRYLDGTWRTIRTGRSSSNGSFRVTGTAQDAGVGFWRIAAAGGGTNADGVSSTMKLTVSKPPPTGGGGGGGGGGGNDDPPPPPDDPPPPEG